MILKPIDLAEVRRHVGAHHSHNRGDKLFWKFGTSVIDPRGGGILGVGAAGRPKARGLDSGYDGDALEIVRVCTTGDRNACSMIYGALCRAGFALGYDPIYTYTLISEPASCVRAAGFTVDAELAATPGWDRPARPRVNVNLFGEDETPREGKVRWIRRRDGSVVPRLMSCSLTTAQVVARTKTVTRRMGWLTLRAGDRLTLCAKVRGRKKGEPLERIAEVIVVDVRRERLDAITLHDVTREGFLGCNREWFVEFFCKTHKGATPDTEVTRIEWRYLDE